MIEGAGRAGWWGILGTNAAAAITEPSGQLTEAEPGLSAVHALPRQAYGARRPAWAAVEDDRHL